MHFKGVLCFAMMTKKTWLFAVSSVPIRQALRYQQTAFKNFWEKRAKHPAFKKKMARQSASFASHKITIYLQPLSSREFEVYKTVRSIANCGITLSLMMQGSLPELEDTMGIRCLIGRALYTSTIYIRALYSSSA